MHCQAFSIFHEHSPFASFKKFNYELGSEEIAADNFAAKMHRTAKDIDSAKKRVSAF